jgi:hypothetical protein
VFSTKRMILFTVLNVAILAIFFLYMTNQKQVRLTGGQGKVMSAHDRVVQVLVVWSGSPARPADDAQLQVIWATSQKDVRFYPEAAQILTGMVQYEFRESKTNVLKVSDIFDSTQNTGGKAKSVQDLCELVRTRYRPPTE